MRIRVWAVVARRVTDLVRGGGGGGGGYIEDIGEGKTYMKPVSSVRRPHSTSSRARLARMPMEISCEIKERYRPAGTADNSFHYSYESPKQPLLHQEGKMKAGLHHLSSTADERIW